MKKKPSICFSKKIVVFCIGFIVLYTVVQLLFSYQLNIELSPTLTTCVYAFFGTELAASAVIKVFDTLSAEEDKLESNSEDSSD